MSRLAGAVAAIAAALAIVAVLGLGVPGARAAPAASGRPATRHRSGAAGRLGAHAAAGGRSGAHAAAGGGAGARPGAGAESAAHAKPRAPTGPPLVSGPSAFATSSGGGEETVRPSKSRPLVSNGLGSPLCRGVGGGRGGGVSLTATARANCLNSGFVAAAAPTGNYEFDVHIETGFPDFKGQAASFVEDYLIQPPWIALVWAVHALLIAMQWAYLLAILHSPAMRTVAGLLRALQRTVTRPWLVVVLSIASVLLAYRGIVKRRVADTLGEALAILAMMAAGLWMIADPIGTVGAAAGLADAASLQTLAAVSTGTPAKSGQALTDAAGQLFGATVDGPWCYMEFGNVAWCEDPSRLDGKLRAAGLRIAAAKRSQAAGAGPASAARKREAARLLRSAKTNGELFLALAANGPERNSINEEGSLLRTLCVKASLKSCVGRSAPEAEFRDEGNFLYRCAGLVLIAAGGLGMVLLLAFIVVRLLGAALMSLLLLLAAPVVVLLPALGENGRARYREWAGRLLGAVLTKLIWSFLLGIVLVAMKLVLVLHGLGWWVQWLLLTVLWWGAFRHRHDLLGLARIGGDGSAHRPASRTVVGRAGSRARDFAWGLLLERIRERRGEPSLPDGGRGRKPSSKPKDRQKTEKAPPSEGRQTGTVEEPAGRRKDEAPADPRERRRKKQPADGQASPYGRRGPAGERAPHEGGGGRSEGAGGGEPEAGAGAGRPTSAGDGDGGTRRGSAAGQARRQRDHAAQEGGDGEPDQRSPAPGGGPAASEHEAFPSPSPSPSPTRRQQPPDPGRATFDEVVQRIREDAAARRGGAGGEDAGRTGRKDAGGTGREDPPGGDSGRAARARRRRQLGEG